jgi:hypothetical protein
MFCKSALTTDFVAKLAGSKVAMVIQKAIARNNVDLYKTELPYLQDRVMAERLHKKIKEETKLLLERLDPVWKEIVRDRKTIEELGRFRVSGRYKAKVTITGFINTHLSWVGSRCFICDLTRNNDFVSCETCSVRSCNACRKILEKEYKIASCVCCVVLPPKQTTTYDDVVIFAVRNKMQNILSCVRQSAYIYDMTKDCDAMRRRNEYGFQSPEQDDAPKQFIRKCLDTDCRGFLSTAWKCGLCELNFCSKCHQTKSTPHECNPDDVATIVHLAKESKPCPKCHMPISRIDGCNQVWTPCCKIAFNWATGKIEMGVIHSPEYFAYLRRTGQHIARQQGDVLRGGDCLPATFQELHEVNMYFKKPPPMTIHLIKRDCYNIEFEYCRENPACLEIDNSKYGVRYLLGEITQKQWERSVCVASRARERFLRMIDIYKTFTTVMVELMNILYASPCEEDDFDKFMTNFREIANFTNTELDRVYTTHGLKNKSHRIELHEDKYIIKPKKCIIVID